MSNDILDTILLLALPASGKSEVRKYLRHLPPKTAAEDFHMGASAQLDDFPYVHLMRRIDDELSAAKAPRIFFKASDKPFLDPKDWGTLIELLNEDHVDLIANRKQRPQSAALDLFERLDRASIKVGAQPRLKNLGAAVIDRLAPALEKDARDALDMRQAAYPPSMEGRTLVIECARGGPHGSKLPLAEPFGYRYSLSRLSEAILEKAAILYVWVTPEESRRKNEARSDPNDPGSILHHSVPIDVMMNDYGLDDMDWLEKNARKPGTISIEAHGKTFDIPIGRFDNRVDKTSFLRDDAKDWDPEKVKAVHDGLKDALDTLAKLQPAKA
ncbi:MAG: hypothetical protein V3S11_06890 [Elusimicrobiota bacterium]